MKAKRITLKKLTKNEKKHLAETIDGRVSLAAFVRNREFHAGMKVISGVEPCYDCRSIAIKIGLET
jgi:hypothetical protein